MTQARLLWLLLVLTATSSGCAMFKTSRVILYPIEKSDIMPMKKGECFSPEKDGFFLSALYLEEVAKAKVEEKSK